MDNETLEILATKIIRWIDVKSIIDKTPTHALFIQRIAPQGSQRTPATFIAAITPELTVGILNSVF